MHIVDITMFYPAQTGGVRTYLAAKSKWLAQRPRVIHTVVAPVWKGATSEGAVVPLRSVPIPGSKGFRLPLSTHAAQRALHRLQPDLIEVGDPYQLAWAALHVKRALGIPAVAFYHSDLPGVVSRRFGEAAGVAAAHYLRYLYREFDLVLAPSLACAQRLRDLGIRHVRHQPLGVDTSLFHPGCRDQALRRQLGLRPDARLLVYAGRFSREKKLPILIEAIEHLGPPYHLLMVGGKMSGVQSSQVTCLPFQNGDALAKLIASSDALVHPGDQETFGLVVLEAMSCGVPVIGVNAGGVAELIDESCGLLVQPNNPDAMVQGIRQLYRQDMHAMGLAARERVCRSYDWRIIMPQLMQHYASLLAGCERAALQEDICYGLG